MNPKLPPHDLDAERAVLGALLLDPDAVIQVVDLLIATHFYDESHRLIYDSMVSLYTARQAVDALTVAHELKRKKKLESIGGASTLVELSNGVSTTGNVLHYARIVRGCALRRMIISLSAEFTNLAFDESRELSDVVNQVEREIFALTENHVTRSFTPIKATLSDSFERLEELQKSGGALRGLPTGFNDLDNMLAGLQKSNLIILAARPGMGKTAFALNIAHHISVSAKKKVGVFSLEMSREELVDRLLVAQADIDAWRLKTGRLDQKDFMKLSDAMGVLAESQLYIDDTPGLSIFEMRTKARRLMSEQKIDLLVVDYLQLAHGSAKDNRVQEVAEISQGLKNIARELKIPVLALSQLNRAVESRGEKMPQLSDLRESGSIEQDADVVMFLYRKDDDIRELMKLKIAKHRNGPLGEIDLYFKGDRIRFYGMESKAN